MFDQARADATRERDELREAHGGPPRIQAGEAGCDTPCGQEMAHEDQRPGFRR